MLVSTSWGLKTNDAQPTSKEYIKRTNGYRRKYDFLLPDTCSCTVYREYIPTKFFIILQTLL